jgi:ferrous iron transport protein A
MSLSKLGVGDYCTIVKIHTDKKVKCFLQNLGLIVGSTVYIISKVSGDYILGINDSRIALDKSLASSLLIKV